MQSIRINETRPGENTIIKLQKHLFSFFFVLYKGGKQRTRKEQNVDPERLLQLIFS